MIVGPLLRKSLLLAVLICGVSCSDPWCPDGWKMDYESNACYKAVLQYVTWTAAEDICASYGNGSHLVSIHNDPENLLVEAMMDGDNVPHNGVQSFWIGMSKLDPTRHTYWTDDTSVNYLAWSVNQPDNGNIGGIESCIEMFTNQVNDPTATNPGKWNDNRCDNQRSFVCKMPCLLCIPPSVTTPPTVVNENCRAGWQEYSNGIGGPSDIAMSFDDAFKFCRSLSDPNDYDRSNLASIRDVYDQKYLESMVVNYTQDVWIGLWVNPNPMQWYDDRTPLDYTNFDPNNIFTKSGCAKMHTDKAKLGYWATLPLQSDQPQVNGEALDCSYSLLGYICEQYTDPNVTTPAPSSAPVDSCPTGFVDYPGYGCYAFFNQSVDFKSADANCRALSGTAALDVHLVSMIDPYELSFIISRAMEHNLQNFWIGLERINGSFQWLNGWPVDVSIWGAHQPNIDPNMGCVRMSLGNVHRGADWFNDNCSLSYPYICKVSFDKYEPPPQGALHCNGSDQGWFAGDDACYFLAPQGGDYFAAEVTCQNKYASNLASIHSWREVNVLKEAVQIWNQTDYFYIGLHEYFAKGFSWFDGSPVDFANWASNVSLNANLSTTSSCLAVWMDSDGFWHYEDCYQRQVTRQPLCMRPKLSNTPIDGPTSSPRPRGTGGLSSGAQAGIAIAVITAILLVIGVGYFVHRNYLHLSLPNLKLLLQSRRLAPTSLNNPNFRDYANAS